MGTRTDEIQKAAAAFDRDKQVLFRRRDRSTEWNMTQCPSWNFMKYEYKPVPKPEFKWPEGLNVASMRINEGLWLELCFHGSPTIAVPLNTLKGDIIKSMEVDKVYRNPLGQEPPVKPQLQH